ncbi:hypothetical protein F5Y19DRAFT_468645 [Xylariaceae sp. FL1651]|nr:hypothetical protein F5Y19DRAFT_468645 [Xylariaceae sp. FL1651]
MDVSVETFLPELDERANRILELIKRIIELLSVDILVLLKDEISAKWESDYRCRDLSEQVTKLKKELREIRSAAEAAQDDKIKALKVRIRELEARIEELESQPRDADEKLIEALSKNWELGYRCRDLSGDVWRLKQQLRRRIALGDVESLSFNPKTALERALENRIDELEGRGKHPRRKARSRSM